MDDNRITYERISTTGGWGSCYGVKALDSTTRHALIAHWLGVSPRDMPWQPDSFDSILYTSKDQYLHDLGALIDKHRVVLRATVEQLRERKVLGTTESTDITPRLNVRVLCAAVPCPLPDLEKAP